MLEDRELRDLFKVESDEHLRNLENGLLNLEAHPSDTQVLGEVTRAAHSLKGAARMLGLGRIESLAHQVEDTLSRVKRGEIEFTSLVFDEISPLLDTIRACVVEAVGGGTAQRAAPADVPMVPPAADQSAPKVADGRPTISTPAATPEVGRWEAEARSYRIDTIRVEPKKLDDLMAHAGELIVTQSRIARRLSEIEAVSSFLEDHVRESMEYRLRLRPSEPAWRENLEDLGVYLKREQEFLTRLGGYVSSLGLAVSDDNARLETVTNEISGKVKGMRLLPLTSIFDLFPRMVRDLARFLGKEVQFLTEGGEIRVDKLILEEIKDPLMHLIRNAVDHGLERAEERLAGGKTQFGTVQLLAKRSGNDIIIEVSDDGRGISTDTIREALRNRGVPGDEVEALSDNEIKGVIFNSGFSTSTTLTAVSGRGIGLDVVKANVQRLHGNVTVESSPGVGAVFRIVVPATLATAQVFIVSAGHRVFALPLEAVHSARPLAAADVFLLEGKEAIAVDGGPVPVANLLPLLGMDGRRPDASQGNDHKACLIITSGDQRLGLVVDEIVDQQQVTLAAKNGFLKSVRCLSAVTALASGEVCPVLDPGELIRLSGERSRGHQVPLFKDKEARPVILLAEDSITTRTQMKRILESSGFEVVTAVDGFDAYNKLKVGHFDALVSDVQMPNLDGLGLTSKLRAEKAFTDFPIILVTGLSSEEDRKRGAEAGANAYITKNAFDQKELIDTLRRVI